LIPELLLAAWLAAPARAEPPPADPPAEAPPPEEAPPEDPLAPWRAPFEVLAERAIGTTSRPVEYNWRRSKVQLAAMGDHLYELNNFNSLRAGGMARLPSERLIFELGASYVWVWDTPSSEQLALTPYRQPGRPDRLELDFGVAVPLAEGVVTTFPRFFPAAQLVLHAIGELRYAVYPGAFEGLRAREAAAALFAPALSEAEIDNLDGDRLDAMQIDPGRYGLLLGMGNDVYFRQGIFVSPRAMFALPILALATRTELLFWADVSLVVGVSL